MSTKILWRIDGVSVDAPLNRPEALTTGLMRHLRTSGLVSSLVQIRDRQQAYVSLSGCVGCAHGRCEVGCRVEALRRTLRAAHPMITLTAVPRGMARRPYTRLAVAVPTAQAQPLTGELLHEWAEARLTVAFVPTPWRQLAAGAALYVGAEGASPLARLRTLGWRAWAWWSSRAPDRPITPQPWLWIWPADPWLLLPTPVVPVVDQVSEAERPITAPVASSPLSS